ncbi:MAG: cytochrome c oxidase assembly protein [Micromonosporaceae bacterium]|nr:cytochrome c oxidase assembly protein [Micromonosporaceae bacterium]
MIAPTFPAGGPALTHAGHAAGAGWSVAFPLALVLAVLYLTAAARVRPGWPRSRTVGWLVGCALVAGVGSPFVTTFPYFWATDPRTHMLSHLLLGMFAPLALVLAAPVTLLLRVCPPVGRRRIIRVLRSRPARMLAHPITGLVLSTGGLYVILLTPLYAAGPVVDQAVQVHYLAAGCLLTWSLVGLDPSPHRARMSMRVGVLVAAAAAHAVLAKYLYAAAGRMAGELATDARTLESAAMLMYYGADLAELLLALVLFSSWYAQRGRRLARSRTAADRGPTGVPF